MITVDSGASPLNPQYDSDVGLLYLNGRGDTNVRFYELMDNKLHYISEFKDGNIMKAFFFVPKYMVDVMKSEMQRLVKITSSHIEVVSMI